MEQNKNRVVTEDDDQVLHQDLQDKRRERELEDIKAILSTPEGVRFFKRLLDEGKMFTTAMTGNSFTFHNEGKRDFVLLFFNDVALVCPEKIPELILR